MIAIVIALMISVPTSTAARTTVRGRWGAAQTIFDQQTCRAHKPHSGHISYEPHLVQEYNRHLLPVRCVWRMILGLL